MCSPSSTMIWCPLLAHRGGEKRFVYKVSVSLQFSSVHNGRSPGLACPPMLMYTYSISYANDSPLVFMISISEPAICTLEGSSTVCSSRYPLSTCASAASRSFWRFREHNMKKNPPMKLAVTHVYNACCNDTARDKPFPFACSLSASTPIAMGDTESPKI